MQQSSSHQAYLIIRHGQRWTDVLKLIPGQSVIVGRSSDNQVVIRDERASRRHAEIAHQKSGWIVRDLGSRNGTAVDRRTIHQEHALVEGEVITVAGCEMVFAENLANVSESLGKPVGQSTDQITMDGQDNATITHRRNRSQWSSVYDAPTMASDGPGESSAEEDPATFFYRLVFDLVQCETADSLAQTALDRLLRRLNLTCGGVVTLTTSDIERAPNELPGMAVLATKQPTGQAYHRISDFLASTVLRERQALLARNVRNDSQLTLARQSGQRDAGSILCAPLTDRDRVIGLLHVYTTGDERSLTDRDLEIAIGVADNLAIALLRQRNNAKLSESLAKSRRQVDQLHAQLELSREMVGTSQALMRVRTAIARAAPTTATVLVRGESGVGKELVARAIHAASPRRDGPLVCLNCAALAPTLLESELFGHEKGAFTGATDRKVGKFEAADGGTLLLDEIGEMSPDLQAKFLRVLEGQSFERLGGNRPIKTDVRVIAATNRDLEEAVKNKTFRSDLYFRLRVIEMEIPALRQRMEDLPLLVEHFIQLLRHHADRRIDGIAPEALEHLCRHTWPGNVRELRNAIERAMVLGSGNVLEIDDFSIAPVGAAPATSNLTTSDTFRPRTLDDMEREHILATLEFVDGNKSKAAQLLGIERSTLDRKLKRFAE